MGYVFNLSMSLPKKFPEYSMMYKTLSNQIKLLKKRMKNVNGQELKKINAKTEKYQAELNKTKKMFPERFFEEDS